MNKTIYIVGFIQSLFGILLFITKRPRHISFIFLITWLGLIAIFLGVRLLPYETAEFLKSAIFPIQFLFGPILYMYLGSLAIENFRLKPVFLLHLLPFLFICIHRSIIRVAPIISSADLTENPSYINNKIHYSFFILSLFVYWFLSLRIVFKHKNNIPYNFSNYTRKNTLNWSVLVLTLFLVFFVADFSMFYFSKVLNMKIQSLQILPFNITIFTFIIIYFGINQTVIYEHKTYLAESITVETESADNIIIDRTLMDEKQIEELTDTILLYLNGKKPFLNPDYSLQMMVEDLKISRQKLSYLINIGQQKNFYKLINEYRVGEVKGKLLDPGFNHYSVLGIGLECGFNSKTSFNRIFKEETGYTPTEFKKKFTC